MNELKKRVIISELKQFVVNTIRQHPDDFASELNALFFYSSRCKCRIPISVYMINGILSMEIFNRKINFNIDKCIGKLERGINEEIIFKN